MIISVLESWNAISSNGLVVMWLDVAMYLFIKSNMYLNLIKFNIFYEKTFTRRSLSLFSNQLSRL